MHSSTSKFHEDLLFPLKSLILPSHLPFFLTKPCLQAQTPAIHSSVSTSHLLEQAEGMSEMIFGVSRPFIVTRVHEIPSPSQPWRQMHCPDGRQSPFFEHMLGSVRHERTGKQEIPLPRNPEEENKTINICLNFIFLEIQ